MSRRITDISCLPSFVRRSTRRNLHAIQHKSCRRSDRRSARLVVAREIKSRLGWNITPDTIGVIASDFGDSAVWSTAITAPVPCNDHRAKFLDKYRSRRSYLFATGSGDFSRWSLLCSFTVKLENEKFNLLDLIYLYENCYVEFNLRFWWKNNH